MSVYNLFSSNDINAIDNYINNINVLIANHTILKSEYWVFSISNFFMEFKNGNSVEAHLDVSLAHK